MNVDKRNIILIGGFIETIELVLNNGFNIVGIVDKSVNNISFRYRESFAYMGNDKEAISLMQNMDIKLPILLSPDLPIIRQKLFKFYGVINSIHINLISDKANVSLSSSIEEGSSVIIQDFVNVSSNVTIAKCVHINTYANVMHDCILEDFVTIAPNAVLLGAVHVGENSYIGANATILPGIEIGKNAIIGAGAVVTKDVKADEVVAGVPAKKIKSNQI
jgi:sugar O-acyltransferase (sialic acid O-acetyltransferase NeuD family)